MSTKIDDRQVVNRSALTNLGNTANATLDTIFPYINTHVGSATAHGTSSAIVGVDDIQTLTNKTLAFLRTTVSTDSTTTGASATLAAFTTGVIRLTNASLTSVSGIPAGVSGQNLEIENQTGVAIQIKDNDTGASANDRIRTGTGAPITVMANSSLKLVYDATLSKWMLVGGTGSGSGSGSGKNYLTSYIASTSSGSPNPGNGDFELASTTGWTLANSALTSLIPTTIGSPTTPIAGNLYIFNVAVVYLGAGATYTNNGQTFTAVTSVTGTNTVICFTGTGTPQASGTLTKASGVGDTTITYTAFKYTAPNAGLSIGVVSNTGAQLAGSTSGYLLSSGASTAGDMMISSPFYIDNEDKAKMLGFSFTYQAYSGAANMNFSGSSSNTLAVYIYDVTNATWLQPAGVYNLVQNSGIGKCSGTFQTSSTGTRYQIAVVNVNASAGTYTMLFDDFSVSPQVTTQGAFIGDWVAYTPTFGAGFGTPTNVFVESRREGDSLHVRGKLTAGTVAANTASITLGYNGANGTVSIDTSKASSDEICGSAATALTSTTFFGIAPIVSSYGWGAIWFGMQTSTTGGATGAALGNQIAATGGAFSFDCLVPILGWSSNSVMSNDTDTRVVAFSADSNSTQSIGTSTPIQITGFTPSLDTHAAWNAANQRYVIPVSGNYHVKFNQFFSAASTAGVGCIQSRITVNGTTVYIEIVGGGTTASQTRYGIAEKTLALKAGDYVQFDTYQDTGSTISLGGFISASIERLSGPAVIAASETVAVHVSGSGTSIGTSPTTIVATTVVKDTHGAYSAGTYTAPVSGWYTLSATLHTGSTSISFVQLYYQKNAETQVLIGGSRIPTTPYQYAAGTITVYLLAGNTIKFQADINTSTSTPNAFVASIIRTGN